MLRFSQRLPDLATNRFTDAIRRRRDSGLPLIDLTESNPTRAGFDYPDDLLQPLSNSRALTYAPSPLGSVDARRAVADDYARHGLDVNPERIVLTSSSSEAYSLLFKILADAGDEIVVPRPSYPLFDALARLDSVTTTPYDLEYHGRWSIDFDGVARALTPRTRAILAVSPNNPTGSYIRRDELDRMAAIAGAHGVALIVDEVFADYELEAGAKAAAGRAVQCGNALTFSLGGMSKALGLPQVKLGWMAVAGPDTLVEAALHRLEHAADTYLSVSTPVQVAAVELFRTATSVREQIANRVRDNYRDLKTQSNAVPSCRTLSSEGGWYAVLHVPSLESEESLILRLLDEGVLTHPGYFFDFPRESFLIVSLLPRADAFHDGVARVLRHFACTLSADRHV